MSPSCLPKIAPSIVERPRISAWLSFCALSALRLIIAPAGSGKTASVVVYARSRPNRCDYIKLIRGTSGNALLAMIFMAIGKPVTTATYAALLAELCSLPRTEMIFDNIDEGTDDARAILARLFHDAPDHVTFIYLTRSSRTIDSNAAQAQGLVEICDETLFAFDEQEIGRFARSLNLEINEPQVRQLAAATHGWAIAVAGTCRTAAAYDLPLDDALAYWRRVNDAAVHELVMDSLRFVPAQIRATFTKSVTGHQSPPAYALTIFKRYGLFVTMRDGSARINPLLREEDDDSPSVLMPPVIPYATVELFGRFSMSIDGRTVDWKRRRDRQIIQFLAMRPSGRASRADLIAAFWPGCDPQLAGQSLRTACSTIRRAIGDCVGGVNVARYFVADQIVELSLKHCRISARHFELLFTRGQAADEQNDNVAAFSQYRAAETLYTSPFLAGEPPMAWAIEHEARLAQMFKHLSVRLGELSAVCATAAARDSLHFFDELSA